ncbi:MAG TPA: type I-F CRISPR-associated protein Csy2 [Accumulibacter sp.]|nr:type I-F CRISPR-associated protein Csy2 [Accumulibacter sp.]HNF91582.1 type I-F CRISPR-associated protein Csy2 [Accumulibacter sp.]
MTDPFARLDAMLVLRLRVQNANAVSSPLTWGFPAPSAFLGFVHALERRLARSHAVSFPGVGIVCHAFEAQTFRPNRRQHRIFTQTRNPVFLKREASKFIAQGTPAAIVEEGRAHLDVSLVIAVKAFLEDTAQEDALAEAALELALSMRLAGGSIFPAQSRNAAARWISLPGGAEVRRREAWLRFRYRLLPGFALVHRPDLLAEELLRRRVGDGEVNASTEANANVLDALLDIASLHHLPPAGEGADGPADWHLQQRNGWLVPLPIGYAGLSPLYEPGEVAGARDPTVPFRFVESLYSLGQWVAPHRVQRLEQLFWCSSADPQQGLYRCDNRYAELNEPLSSPEFPSLQGV